jgi:NAD(P)-dependent dehydrogenase (short-subunit alcohol dehydrogenase family)
MSDSDWTTADIGDQSGRIVIVTGANIGLGLETTRELMRKGAHCVIASRTKSKADAALAELEADGLSGTAEVIPLDLASLDSVKEFVAEFRTRHEQLDLLINNAGIMMVPEGETQDGFESQLGTNHLGHFGLTGLLLDQLLATEGSRVVSVASMAHRSGKMDFDNLMFENGGYTPMGAYGRSKLANLLFAFELQRRLETAGATTISVAAHPGVAGTNLGSHMFDSWFMKPVKQVLMLALQSAAKGALPTLRAATDPSVSGGEYFGPKRFSEQRGAPVLVGSTSDANSEPDAHALWDRSIELTGVDFSFG